MTEEKSRENNKSRGNKTYDMKIIKWLFRFGRPYKLFMILSFVLMLFAAFLELTIPYLAKVAVDSYITPSWAKIYKTSEDEDIFRQISLKYKDSIIELDGRSSLINLKQLTRVEKTNLEKSEAVSDSRYIVINPEYYDGSDKTKLNYIIATNSKNFIKKNSIYYSNFSTLNSMPKADLLFLRRNDTRQILFLSALILGCMFLVFVFTTAFTYLLNFSGHKIMHTIRTTVFSHVLSLPQPFFDQNPVGRLTTRITNDINSINEMYTSVLVQFCKDLLVIIGILVVMFFLNKELTLIMFIFTLIVAYVAVRFRMRLKNVYRKVRISIAKLNAYVQESVRGIILIKLYNREESNLNRFKEVNNENFRANMDQLFAFATFRPIIEFISISSVGLILWYGGRNVISLNLSLGALIAFLYYVRMLFRPIQELAERYNIFQSAAAASENLYDLVNEHPEQRIDFRPKSAFKGKLEFKNVWFAYTAEKWVLKDVSFKIDPGKTVALVGYTGSGKTTIVNLILKFYEINKGEILIDDININDYDPEYLRENISSVFQDTFLMGQNEGDDGSAYQAPSLKGIYPVTTPSNNGHHISSGEKQLVSLEKAFSKNANFLIMDEATSHIDASLEQSIRQVVREGKGKKTTLIIAHRLPNVKDADRIIVIHNGEIIEEGAHAELLKSGGLYSNLYKLQSEISSLNPDENNLDIEFS
ncbi:MAG: ABC transporter ATP-binding protein [Candidatus Dadabacteria bacterium]|nr:ABC transporter ATP-binding protein [Candidatus Dadabacteria bacterium]NIS08433.1 ABC transporter ATP-binding protein [Candidatus Dadabacteria bacterium]NIV41998.1 ATP-binding cassette domain-containing protein [Candidatus Dadabacteria bacterium]NIY21921.1 ATP-binding cassette domain-containing protein [Candidatus Dadabacteria bacterium]